MKDDSDQADAADMIASAAAEPEFSARQPLIVGIAAGRADHPGLAPLLSQLSAVPDLAVIICLARQEASEDERLIEALLHAANTPAALVTDGGDLLAGQIYLVPSGLLVTVDKGTLQCRCSPDSFGNQGRIDSLLVSIADQYRERTVAVVLSGTGSDGTLGATAVKEQGGLALAEQEPDAAEMPPTADGAARTAADHVLPMAQIAGRIIHHAECVARSGQSTDSSDDRVMGKLEAVATIIHDRTGRDLQGYKKSTFIRRIQRRMQVTGAPGIDAYLQSLEQEPDEAANLFNEMLIGVTQFFRDPKEFDRIEKDVIPRLFQGKGAADQVRIWVLGCATGEEAYSLAILLREHMDAIEDPPHVQIFATDVDGRALASARVGRYRTSAMAGVRPDRLARWFTREGDTYCVAKELREMCLFSLHDLINDAPFSRLDLISCRNLLIYLDTDMQDRVIPLFHFALRPGGFLFLGNGENVTRHAELFLPMERGVRIFRRVERAPSMLPRFPLSSITQSRPNESAAPLRRLNEGNLARRAAYIAERYAPAYVIVDDQLAVLHFSSGMGRFLDPSTGAASLNLLNLVHRDLRLELRAAMHKSVRENLAVRVPPLRMAANDEASIAVSMFVEPVWDEPYGSRHFVVLFREGEMSAALEWGSQDLTASRDSHVQELEEELRLTRERLHASIEDLERANEALKSSNEEYQSINEELQAANEELETSKEELQSVNEELQTVNGELAHRVHELARANSDLKNLLESTQIATIFLDNDVRIKNFTPAITDIFHLIESDIGRPIAHITSRVAYDELEEDVRRVMRTLSTVEREIEDPRSGARFLVRVLPYRSVDNFIAGVVLTFLDVTATAKAEQALRASEERFRMMAQAVPAFLFTLKADLQAEYINQRYYEYTGLSEGSGLGHGWLVAVHPDDAEEMQRRWEQSVNASEPFEMELRIRAATGSYRWFLSRCEPQRDAKGEVVRWFGSGSDIHDQRTAADLQRLLMAELQHRVKNILAVVRSIFARSVAGDDEPDSGAHHFRGRLDSLARTQNVLARTPEGGIDLEEMVCDELTSHGAQPGEQINIVGPPIRLRQKAAEALGLAIHELATNASKYGALATGSGRIAVTWRLYDRGAGPRLAFKWVETGVKLIDPSPSRIGFGRELIEQGLPYQLGATTALEFASGGVRCAIELPLNDRVAVFNDDDSAWGDLQ